MNDWRDILMNLDLPSGNEGNDDAPEVESADTAKQSMQSKPVHIVIERKGRGGKTATIICDLEIDDSAVRQLASDLRRSLACGGSVRGNEILIQGDRAADCRTFLTKRGFKVK